MKKDFVLTKEDYIDFNLYFYNNSPQLIRKRNIQRFIFPVVYLLIPVFLNNFNKVPYKQTLPIFIIAAIAWLIIYPKLSIYGVEKNVKRIVEKSEKGENSLTGDYTIETKEDGLLISKENGNVDIKWNQIIDLKEDDKRIYIFMSPMVAYIVKKEAFSPDEEEVFKQLIKSNSDNIK
ncbi:MAG: YcxB family protein [Andreesenia angusta]|nr:YcxB family protein [Andreesenia angusta]